MRAYQAMDFNRNELYNRTPQESGLLYENDFVDYRFYRKTAFPTHAYSAVMKTVT